MLQEENVEEMLKTGTEDLIVSLHQMDLDRTMFLWRSYLRVRLQKVYAVVLCSQLFLFFCFFLPSTYEFLKRVVLADRNIYDAHYKNRTSMGAAFRARAKVCKKVSFF